MVVVLSLLLLLLRFLRAAEVCVEVGNVAAGVRGDQELLLSHCRNGKDRREGKTRPVVAAPCLGKE